MKIQMQAMLQLHLSDQPLLCPPRCVLYKMFYGISETEFSWCKGAICCNNVIQTAHRKNLLTYCPPGRCGCNLKSVKLFSDWLLTIHKTFGSLHNKFRSPYVNQCWLRSVTYQMSHPVLMDDINIIRPGQRGHQLDVTYTLLLKYDLHFLPISAKILYWVLTKK